MKNIVANEFDRELESNSVPVLVDFYTDECSPCRHLSVILQDIENERLDRIKIVKVNAAEETDLAVRFRVSNVPKLLLFQNGEVVRERVGLASKSQLLAWIDGK